MWKKGYSFILCILSFVTYGNSLISPINSRNKIGKALDYQCFTGETTKILQDKYPRLETFGVDTQKEFIDIASKKYPDLKFSPVIFNNNWEEYFETKFNVIQVSDYQDFFETFFFLEGAPGGSKIPKSIGNEMTDFLKYKNQLDMK